MKQMIKSILTTLFLLLILSSNSYAQVTQTIRGIVTDRSSGAPLSYVTVGLLNLPQIGTATDNDGRFELRSVPVGRHDVQASFVGYQSVVFREVMLTSAKEVTLEIQLAENVNELGEVIVTVQTNKDLPLNKMALSGARMLSVEEASRYAGGMDDPSRLVSSFAGVAAGVGNNGISIHGNSPSLLQWRLEDVEIPNPNHFADLSTLGGGVLSSLSSNVLGNSDFLTSAFPAEYGNAVSGVFDMKLRNGNSSKYEHTFQVGILGIDVASEGPLSKKSNASYIFNYRYSTTGLMNKLGLAETGGLLDYQDLNFKLNFPMKKAGILSVWGTGLIDKAEPDFERDTKEWEYKDDQKASFMEQTSAAAGISHRYFFGENGLLKTTLATTYSKVKAWEDFYDMDLNSTPWLNYKGDYTNFILTSSFDKKYSARHTNKTGFTVTNMRYDMQLQLVPIDAQPLETVSKGKGETNLISAYTSSAIKLNDRLDATIGLNGQFFTLNNSWTIEPRAALKWQMSSKNSLAIAYGLHSRTERTDVYFVQQNGKQVNKDLGFTKSHHASISFNHKLSDDMNVRIEPYFQYLYDVPVMADSSYSILNRDQIYIQEALVSKGKGMNYGVDLTFEKYMTRGLYYMVTASLFNSRYAGGDGVWHNTRFNRNFIVNGLIGKEWMLGRNKQNVLSVNLKLTVQGGDRYSPVDEQASMAHPDKETQYDETRAFSKQFSPIFIANYSVSYRMNMKNTAHEFAIKGVNATGYKEYYGHEYNLQTGVIEPRRGKTSLINASYKLNF